MITVVLFLLLLGVCLGSFVNALVWRTHKHMTAKSKKAQQKYSISRGRSMCVHCEHPLAPKDLIPVVSWLWLRGRCRYCQKSIQDTPVAELLMPALFLISYSYWPYDFQPAGVALFCIWLVMLVCLLTLFLYDLRWHILPNRIVYPFGALAVLHVLIQMFWLGSGVALVSGVLWGVLCGGGLFWVLYTVSHGKWIGFGDVRLGVAYGILLGGPVNSLICLFIASLLGSIISIPLLSIKKLRIRSQIPFGPFLISGVFIVYIFGQSIVTWYRGLIGL